MKKAIIVTSAIEVDNNYPLTYSNVRSHFSNEERFRQTVSSIANLDLATDSETHIYLVDISENSASYGAQFGYQPNLTYVGLKDRLPDVWQIVRTHKNKSYCENLCILSFLNLYKEELTQYDYYFKFSGRYLIDRKFDIGFFNENTKPGFYFKHPMQFEWNDTWGYSMVDLRQEQNNNLLYQYCSVLYGWSKEFYPQYVDIIKVIAEICSKKETQHYDVETLLYYFTRQYSVNITEMPWIIYGWDGVNGRFLRY